PPFPRAQGAGRSPDMEIRFPQLVRAPAALPRRTPPALAELLEAMLAPAPGPNQALLTSRVLSGGRRAGFAAVRGLAAGMAVHVAAATIGLSALLASS